MTDYFLNIYLDQIEASSLKGDDTDDVSIYTHASYNPPKFPPIPIQRHPSSYWQIHAGPNRIPRNPAVPQGEQIMSSRVWGRTSVWLRLVRRHEILPGEDTLGEMQIIFSIATFCSKEMLMSEWENRGDAKLLTSPWGGPYSVECFGNGCNYTLSLRFVSNLSLFPPPGCREFLKYANKKKGACVRWNWKEKPAKRT